MRDVDETPREKYKTQEYSPKTESLSLAERETLRKGRRGRTTVPVPYDPFLSRLGCGGGVDIKIPRRNLGIKLIGRMISNLRWSDNRGGNPDNNHERNKGKRKMIGERLLRLIILIMMIIIRVIKIQQR